MMASAAWRAPVAPLLCLGAYALGLARGPWPLVAASLFGLLLYASQVASRRVAPWAFAAAGAVMLGLALGAVPGFSRLDLGPVTVNTAKALGGLAAAVMLPSAWRWNRACTLAAAACLIGVPALAWAVGQVRWAPTGPALLAVFAAGNLFGTLAEEWFFRRWVQTPLQRLGSVAAVVLTAVLFGLAHLGAGQTFALLAGVAGLGYAAVFQLSGGSVWAAVAVHLALNVLRVGLFGH